MDAPMNIAPLQPQQTDMDTLDRAQKNKIVSLEVRIKDTRVGN